MLKSEGVLLDLGRRRPREGPRRSSRAWPASPRTQAEERLHELPHALINGLTPEKAEALKKALEAAGAEAEVEPLKTYNWPLPYNELTNPLSIDLTALNTFILICSSVTMVLALAALQRRQQGEVQPVPPGHRPDRVVLPGRPGLRILSADGRATIIPPGISATGHFRPSVSLFASCFFTMTGFHGAHVFGGVVMLTCIFIQSLRGGLHPEPLQPGRAGRALLALRRPRLDHPVHRRLPALIGGTADVREISAPTPDA